MKTNCIGTDQKELQRTKELYSLLASDLSVCLMQLQETFPAFEPKEAIEFIRASDPEKWLQIRFAELKQNEHPGLNTFKMIQAGIITIPHELTMSIEDHARIRALIDQIKRTQFYFPLMKLYSEKEKVFELNPEFENEVFEHFSTFAETNEQREIVAGINEVAKGLNKLTSFGVFNLQTNGTLMLGRLAEFFDVDKGSEAPLSVSKRLFWRPILRKFNTLGYKPAMPFERLFK